MTWITISDDDRRILAEIERQTDRGAALIASAYVEQRLVSAIKARTNRHEKVEQNLYRGSGALGSFSVKIDLGLLLGIYEPKIHSFLHTIKKIRNDFAHEPEPRDFTSQRIADLTKTLWFTCELLMRNKTTGEEIRIQIDPPKTARESFLNAVKLVLLFLDMETKQMPLRVPASPVMPPLDAKTDALPNS